MLTLFAIVTGFGFDLIFGDPRGFPHPVVLLGKLIAWSEKTLRHAFRKTPAGERLAGILLVLLTTFLAYGAVYALLLLLGFWHPLMAFIAESFLCYQILATKSLRDESMKVHQALEWNDLPGARAAVAMIVGRDTAALDAQGITRAAVETVAENTNDGVIAPLFFMAIGGAPLGMLYKAINTMDSMVGYLNERYRYFGWAAAKLDDTANWFPARAAALLLCLASFFCGFDAKNAWCIWRRDRRNHASPNSAQTEAACAGALGIQLGGTSFYKGVAVAKPTIGDAQREIMPDDIDRANQLLYATALLALLLCTTGRFVILHAFALV